jgi:hypothetical protein
MSKRASLTVLGRSWYAVTAVAALVAIGLETVLVARDPRSGSAAANIANLFTYFTIQSNLVVGAVSLVIALGRGRDATWFRAACVAALLAISITAIVFHLVLAGDIPELTGAAALADTLLHTVVPMLFLAGWLGFGPRGAVRVRTVVCSLVFPLVWLALTLVRGALAGYYPYPFLDVADIGYARMAANVALIAGLYAGLAVGFGLVDGLVRRASTPEPLGPRVSDQPGS